VSIQDEIHKTMIDIQKKTKNGEELSYEELVSLFLTSLIEEEG
jgi:hypothetical protein